jgi:hypothetical protein
VVILMSPKTADNSLKLRLMVMTTLDLAEKVDQRGAA